MILPRTSPPAEINHQSAEDRSDRIAVIGAGTSGLAMARRLKEWGFAFDCLEREADLGGNWNYGQASSSVYASTHLISSKQQTEYLDYPMPDGWPEFPSHRLVLEYLRGYASKHRLAPHLEFGQGVRSVTPLGAEGDGWLVDFESGQKRRYGKLMIANGHNWDPSFPSWSGRYTSRNGSEPPEFEGVEIHSGEYKTPGTIAGKRVLVVGGGNSGCDIAVECSQHAATTDLSLRRGYHFLPKFFHGTPIDVCGERMLRWRLPVGLRRAAAHTVNFFLQGTRAGTGLPKPDHRLFETHPVINSQLIYALRHGDLTVRPDVERLTSGGARFVDGSREPYDVIVYATGFRLSFPFIDSRELNWRGDAETGKPMLHLHVFHPERDDLFMLGMIQPDSGQWGLVDRQARLVAEYLVACEQGASAAEKFREQKRRADPARSLQYVDTPRHRLEVEHFSYGKRLDSEWRRLRRQTNSKLRQTPSAS